MCYRLEAPLPADLKQTCRLVRASSKQERDAVEQVLREFFELRDDGWHNARCDQDIASFHDSAPDREMKRENAKERQRRARERRRELFEALRSHNIVPPWDTPTRALETLLQQKQLPKPSAPVTPPVTEHVTPPVTRDDTVTQTPPPTTHLPKEKKGKVPRERVPDLPCPEDVDQEVWTDWLRLRKSKGAPVTNTVFKGAIAEAQKAGMTLEAFLRAWCLRGSQGLEASWLKPHERGPGQQPPEPDWRREKRERTEQFAGPAAAKRRPETIDMESIDAATRLVG